MYLPRIRFTADSFPSDWHLIGTGHGGFNLSNVNPNTFVKCAGYLSEEDYNIFMEMCDGYGLFPHHLSTRWGVHIPDKPDVHCIVFYYDGQFGQGFALAFRKSDGFSDLWYMLFGDEPTTDNLPF